MWKPWFAVLCPTSKHAPAFASTRSLNIPVPHTSHLDWALGKTSIVVLVHVYTEYCSIWYMYLDLVVRRCSAGLLCARLVVETPACNKKSDVRWLPNHSWKHHPGHTRSTRLDQILLKCTVLISAVTVRANKSKGPTFCLLSFENDVTPLNIQYHTLEQKYINSP